ncbi:hypothetical protein L1987_30477 [Smallanthus sonchifolius]|uniref:Uncharacterized protein n=1 Tax=Smallanthus sonchifolius TaxID=185202 RepID=A0ACB9I4E6_9ASTR|nr:hypothetical protein L1987_30477 [Smallanthus sonchifolius]
MSSPGVPIRIHMYRSRVPSPFIVLQLCPDVKFSYASRKAVSEYKEAKTICLLYAKPTKRLIQQPVGKNNSRGPYLDLDMTRFLDNPTPILFPKSFFPVSSFPLQTLTSHNIQDNPL